LQNAIGKVPSNELDRTFNSFSCVNEAKNSGKVPLNLLESRSSTNKLVS
jgi:hypothetical protein